MTEPARALSVCMLGLPTSGKTTYLVALWAIVKNAEDGDPLTLRGPLPPATAYLDEGVHRLLAAEAVRRTHRDSGEDVELDLALDAEPLVLRQLDISGETLEHAMETRAMPKVVHDRIAGSDGVLLFVHPDKIVRPFTIAEAHRLSQQMGEPPEDDAVPEPLVEPDDAAVRRSAPTAVHIVDMLQVAASAAGKRLPVAVIVSAWDSVEADDPDATPRPWLEGAMPLLAQFLENNADDLPHEVFGVSAQGGDYDEPGKSAVLAEQDLGQRVKTVGPDGAGNDLAVPLRWLLQSRA